MSLLDTASLVITPNGYKEGKLYSVVPSDGSGDLNVTRATTATRVNASGLVELVPYNLLEYSEQFNNVFYTKKQSSITANATTAPNGTTTADRLVEDSTNDSHYINIPTSTVASGTNTISIYAKADGRNWIWLYLFDGVLGSLTAYFNVSNGTIGTVASGLTANIESVGSGWYRCSVTRTQGTAGNGGFGLASADNTISYLGNGTSGIYVWGAQLVEGSTAKDYQKTETRLNIPRLDYSNGTCPSILVEPQRTNLNLYTEDLTNAWYNKFNSSISANAITAPTGLTTADKVVENTSNSFHYIETTNSLVNSSTYTVSAFLKKGERTFGFIGVYTFESKQIRVNLTNGTIDNTVGTWISTSIEDYGNDWYRVIGTFSAGSTTYFFTGSALNATTVSYTGDGTSGIYIWGAQLEAGSYATSYIPTTSASVTRNADVISKTGISSLIGQTSGTVFLDINIDSSFAQDDMRFLDISDGSSTNWYFIGTNVSNEFRFYFKAGGSVISTLTPLTSGRKKMAFAYANNDYVIYINGVQIYSTTTATVGSTSELNLGKGFSGSSFKQFTNSVALWKTRLTNTQLAQLTTI